MEIGTIIITDLTKKKFIKPTISDPSRLSDRRRETSYAGFADERKPCPTTSSPQPKLLPKLAPKRSTNFNQLIPKSEPTVYIEENNTENNLIKRFHTDLIHEYKDEVNKYNDKRLQSAILEARLNPFPCQICFSKFASRGKIFNDI
jgi:hypothetical protein